MLIETFWYVIYLLAVGLLWPHFGLISCGYAYLLAHILYTVLVFLVIRKLCGFRMHAYNLRLTMLFALLQIVSLATAVSIHSTPWQYMVPAIIVMLMILYFFIEFRQIMTWKEIKAKFAQRFKK